MSYCSRIMGGLGWRRVVGGRLGGGVVGFNGQMEPGGDVGRKGQVE